MRVCNEVSILQSDLTSNQQAQVMNLISSAIPNPQVIIVDLCCGITSTDNEIHFMWTLIKDQNQCLLNPLNPIDACTLHIYVKKS